MTFQRRQVLDYEKTLDLNLTYPDPNHFSANGINGYPVIDGAGFLSEDSMYAFTTSHACLINVRNRSFYELMLIRNTNYYDDKGLSEPMYDRNIETLVQIHYVADTPNYFLKTKTIKNHGINSKF